MKDQAEERVQQLLAALRSEGEDPLDCAACQERLPDFLTARLHGDEAALAAAPLVEVRNHLALCAYCAAAAAEVEGWLAESQRDTIPIAASYPSFDLPFPASLVPPARAATEGARLAQIVEAAVAQGKRWMRDASGGLYLLFGPSLAPATAWAVKSDAADGPLAQTAVGAEEVGDWEVEAAAFAQEMEAEGGEPLCRVEVAVYRPKASDAVLTEISVALDDGVRVQTQLTDAAGVAEFADVPVGRLAQAVIYIGLDA